MYLFLGWRSMQDRLSSFGHAIEYCLWGDGRARHTFLLASTPEHPLVLIETDLGDHSKGIQKSMKLNIIELDEIPPTLVKNVFLGRVQSPTAYDDLIKSAQDYVKKHPHYNVLLNNCRTFIEYLIDQIPEFRQTVPRKNGSILEYYHSQAKAEHPGALIKSKKLLKTIRDHHQRTHQICKYTSQIVFNMENFPMEEEEEATMTTNSCEEKIEE